MTKTSKSRVAKNTKIVTPEYCKNCVNNRIPQFTLLVSGQKIHLCKSCWIGFAYGMKQDFDILDKQGEQFFRDKARETYKNETKNS